MQQERFAVSADGLRQLHAGRAPWALVKELIQNAWDEAPEATVCDVTIAAGADGTTVVAVEDDGPGFANISDAWTLMAETPKRGDPTKRGRFNIGEKEIIAVALAARIETAGMTVTFPPEGGRTAAANRRKRGTRVTVTMPWSEDEAAELRNRLRLFRPTDCRLRIDGEEIARRQPLASRETTLRTLIQHGPGLPMTDTRRKTTIDILERANPDESWIYELGIPIQTTTLPFDVDVHQKVPMPPNRNTVSAGYLQAVMTETLNAMHERLPEESFSDGWVRSAVEDERVEDAAVASVKNNRYGAKAVLWSSDTDANMRAAEAGYQVIHPKAMSRKEREVMVARAGLESAKKTFGRAPEARRPADTNQVRRAFAQWVRAIGKVLGMRPKVRYVSAPEATFVAACSTSRKQPEVVINTSFCSDGWLAERGPEQLKLIIHELAHALSNTPMEHGPRWGDACAAAGGTVADAIARGDLVYNAGARPTVINRALADPFDADAQAAAV